MIGAYDNINFRKRAVCVQYTMMCIVFFPIFQIIKMGIYPDPTNSNYQQAKERCLSRKQLDWSEVIDIPQNQEGHYNFWKKQRSLLNSPGMLHLI